MPVPVVYSDFSGRFLQSRSMDLGVITNENAIKSAVRNLILTSNYERPLDPHIGSNIRRALFSTNFPLSSKDLQDSISMTLKNYEPRITLTDVVCTPDPMNHNLLVRVTYYIRSTNVAQSVSVTLKRLR